MTGWFKELVAEVLQLADGRRCLGDAAPSAAGPNEHGPDQRQAGGLAGEPADDLDATAGFPKVRSMKLECRMRFRCSRGKRKCTVSEAKSSCRQATAWG